eukprot:TRINITY_DN81014_c0_g1_i1.p1 TRINITY_DN81014_c0_g1~~TRINITY_DN81014_c0_g1_i1.p1  ORF type:complete len:496 (-),score=81.70 TRINITY_DN81014_c0_g1_i1:313-1650(-)
MEEKWEELNQYIQSYQDEIKCVMGKPEAKNNEIVLKVKTKGIDDHPLRDRIMKNITQYNSWYLFRRIMNAFKYISWYDSDEITDLVWQGIGKITVKISDEAEKVDSKESEVKKWKDGCSKLVLTLPLALYSYQMCFNENELVSLIKVASFQYQPEAKVQLLRAVATEWRVRWGSLYNFQRVLDMEGMFWTPSEDDQAKIATCKSQIGNETFVKAWRVKYIRKSGFRQDCILLLTKDNFYTFSADGTDMLKHELQNMICLDLLTAGSKIPGRKGDLSLRAYIEEPEPEDPLTGCKAKCKCKPPKIPLPNMPKVDMPDMPDMPSMPSLPSMPSMPGISLPDIDGPDFKVPELFKIDIDNPFKREKKKKPPRPHPDVKEKNFCCFVPQTSMSDDERKAFLDEISWATYACVCGKKHKLDYEVFYDDYPGEDKLAHHDIPSPVGGCSLL